MVKAILLSLIIGFYGCKNSSRSSDNSNDNKADICIFKLCYNDSSHSMTVTALELHNQQVYYFSADSMLMTYTNMPVEKGKIIKDEGAHKLLDTIIKIAGSITNDNCDCRSITKNEFIIRPNLKDKKNDIILNEVFDCNEESHCLFIQQLSNEFKKIEQSK